MDIDFTPEEIVRYSRHIVLPEIGLDGQAKLNKSSILIVGTGGLGSPQALYLAACGIGRIGIVDYDVVAVSNLQRQVLFTTADVGKSKVESARKTMLAINPHIQVDLYNDLFSSDNAEKIAAPYDILVDGTDNIPTRYLMNDLCVFSGKPYVYGAISQFFGQAGVFDSSKGACYRCLFPIPPPPETLQPCSAVGVVGVVPGMIGLIQAAEVIKLVVGINPTLTSQLLLYDALDYSMTQLTIEKNPHCKVCGDHPEINYLIDYEEYCKTKVRDIDGESNNSISMEELELAMSKNSQGRIIDLREPVEFLIHSIPTSENIPFQYLPKKMKVWDRSEPIILVCHFGFLSMVSRQILVNEGFKNVKSLKGGLKCWPLTQ